MKYYILTPKFDNKIAYIESLQIDKEILYRLIDGEKITTLDSINPVIKNSTKKFPDLMGMGSSEYFVTDDLMEVISKYANKDNLQFLSVSIKKKQYWLLNVLNNIECFDWDKSEYTTYSNPRIIKRVSKFVLKKDNLSARNIFRVKEMPMHIFISEELKNEIDERDFEGIDFDCRYEIVAA